MTNCLTDELIKIKPYEFEKTEKECGGMFYDALLEELCFHFDNNEKYKKFCETKGFNPHVFSGELSDIPAVQVGVFKEMGTELSSVSTNDIKLTLQSSATSGRPSSILVDKITSKRQARAMVNVISDFIGNKRHPFLVMDVNPTEGFREILGARFAAVSGYLNFASSVGYFLKVKDGKYYFDIEEIRNYVENLTEPSIVFGFTYIFYSEILKVMAEQGVRLSLPKGSKIIHIGGWKKLESEKVSKEEFNRQAADLFGIDCCDVIDIYGFTEQMGLNYPDCPCGCKHASIYSEVIVRDVASKHTVSAGEQGLLEFISPIPHSYPGNVVLTDDIGVIEPAQCPYGRKGTRFRVLGRLKKAEVRGCGDVLSSKLKFNSLNKEHYEKKATEYRVEFFDGDVLNMSSKESLEKIISSLRQRLLWIKEQPIDALIGLIAQCAKNWNSGEMNNQDFKMKGLGFLSTWCTPEHLTTIMSEGLNGNRMHVDGFLPVTDSSTQHRKAVSKGLVCHWLAGNVQILGMFVLIQSILTKNVNLIKLSSRDGGMFLSLLDAFKGQVYTTPGGYKISGDELLKTVAVVYYGHDDYELGKCMSENADVRVAWGGREAVLTVAGYPAKYDCSDLIMGPKLSFSVVAKEMLHDAHLTKKYARRIAVDASVFDQTGCASTHNVFVEKNGEISPKEFAEYLAEGMKKVAVQIPKGAMSSEQISKIHSVRGVYDFKGMVYGDSDSVWTVLYSDDIELCEPVYSRVVFVHPVDDIEDVLEFINDDIQTIGLAAEGEKALKFASKAADKGAVRFPLCGRMLNFDSPWDGMYIADRMVKWVTLGGPSV